MNKKINELIKRRGEILKELNELTREIEDAQTEIFRHIASEKIIIQRYFEGDVIVVSFGRYWWTNRNGDLIGLVDESDIVELKELTQKGVFSRVVINESCA